jgi:nucleosome binding factor SPN SPT16 subunit
VFKKLIDEVEGVID